MAIRLLRAMSIDGRQYGHMDLVLGLSAAQEESLVRGGDATLVANTAMPPALALSQAEVDVLGSNARLRVANAAQGQAEALLWWPLKENVAAASSTPVVTDSSGQLSGTYAGGTRRWGAWPGLAFDGSSRVPMNGGLLAGMTTAARRCGNPASLQKCVDQITIWAVFAHPTAVNGADRTILSYGATQSAKGGFAVGLGGGRERFYSYVCPRSASGIANGTALAACRTEYGGDKITGSSLNPAPAVLNTLTAVAFEFMAYGPGHLISNMFFAPVNVDYGVDLKLSGFNSLPLIPPGSGGTAAATDDVDLPWVLGARATVDGNTFTDNANGLSFLQVGVARHRWNQSLGQRLVRDLAAAPYALPRSLAQQMNLGV